MTEDEGSEHTITLTAVTCEEVVCPFSEGRLNTVCSVFVLFMFILTPLILLYYMLSTM